MHPGTLDGVMTEMGTLGGYGSGANGINDFGVVVGSSEISKFSTEHHAFRQPAAPGSQMVDLGTDGHENSYALSINNIGGVVGYVSDYTWLQRATLWRPDNTRVDLDAWLDTVNPAAGQYWTLHKAFGINSSGMVVGQGTYLGPGASGDLGFLLDASSLIPEPGAFWGIVLALSGYVRPRRFPSRSPARRARRHRNCTQGACPIRSKSWSL